MDKIKKLTLKRTCLFIVSVICFMLGAFLIIALQRETEFNWLNVVIEGALHITDGYKIKVLCSGLGLLFLVLSLVLWIFCLCLTWKIFTISDEVQVNDVKMKINIDDVDEQTSSNYKAHKRDSD